MNIIRKVALAHFKDGKIIMARHHKNTEVYFSLGGKIDPGETDLECLAREVMEEAGAEINSGSIEFLGEFEAPAFGKYDTNLQVRLYRGEFLGIPTPSSEIAELKYFDSSVDPKHLTPITRDHIFPWLKSHGLIN